ncbi:MAG: NAD(P)H-hydrate dehydratase [Chloroflexi bacterium]|nr:NAD(P)H-hydrate dehydratase [Chloroflexota bacterium]MCY3697272.1 NAD(P)H-hydrate dehydratase [Chloroflexota bacterium]
MKLLTSAEMRELEQRAESAGVSTDTLMENAGLAVAQEIWMQLGSLEDRRIAVLVGPGNNGGDGLVAARHLHEWGAQVRVYALRERSDAQWTQTVEQGVPCGAASDDEDFEALEALLSGAEAIVDALLGTGSSRPIDGDLAEIMQRLAAVRERTVKPKLVAVDLPTGLDADSGRLDPLAVAADETVTFHAPKVGLYMQPGAGAAGSVQHVDIGIPPGLDDDLQTEVLERRAARALLPVRAPDAHKGTFGRVLVIAGSTRYPGAALLAARGAYRAGAGLVTIAAPESIALHLIAALPEATLLPLPEHDAGVISGHAAWEVVRDELPGVDAVVLGCGFGQHDHSGVFVRRFLISEEVAAVRGVVVDADGLNLLAADVSGLADAVAPVVLTPHPGEMGRLTGLSTDDVQGRRLTLSRDSAAEWGCHVVLKGANTIVAAPDRRARVSEVAQPALATAGTGDVLSGAIGALIAQGVSPFDAATLGVYLHGDAGNRAARQHGSIGVTAGDVADQLAMAARSLAGEEPVEAPSMGGFGAGLGGGMGDLGSLGQMAGQGGLGGGLEGLLGGQQ